MEAFWNYSEGCDVRAGLSTKCEIRFSLRISSTYPTVSSLYGSGAFEKSFRNKGFNFGLYGGQGIRINYGLVDVGFKVIGALAELSDRNPALLLLLGFRVQALRISTLNPKSAKALDS